MSEPLSAQEVQKILPHRYPFLLVDRIEEVVPGEKAVGLKNVTVNEPFFRGHFPGEPIMPGVLILEALAQVGAVAVLSREEFRGRLVLFRGIDRCRFRGTVRPGDTLRLEVELVSFKGVVGKGKGRALVEGKVVASGELVFALAREGDEVQE